MSSRTPYISMEMKTVPSISSAGIWNPITSPELQGEESQPESARSTPLNRSHRQSLMGNTNTATSNYTADDSDHPSCFRRHKKKVIAGSVCCGVFLLLMIGLMVPLLLLMKTTISPDFVAEIYSLCGTENPYQFNASVHNPSITSATLERSKLSIVRANDSRLLATTWVPRVRIKPGKNPMSIISNVTFVNETATAELLNQYLQGEWVAFRIVLHAHIKVWGVPIRLDLAFGFVFPGKDTQANGTSTAADGSSAITLDKVTVLNTTTDILAVNVGLDLNYTASVVLHLPPLQLDLIYNKTLVGDIVSNPFILLPGITAFNTALLFPRSSVATTSQMTYELANGSPMIFDLTGSANGDATCMLQRVLRSVNLTLDLSDSGALVKRKRDETDDVVYQPIGVRSSASRVRSVSDAFQLGTVQLETVTATNVTISADFATSIPIYGQLPSVVLEYFTEVSGVTRLGVLTVDLTFNEQQSYVSVSLSVEQPADLGSWMSTLTSTPRNDLASVGLLPSRSWVNMATGILSLFSWKFPLFDNGTTSSPQQPPLFAFNRVAVLGNPQGDLPNVIAIGLDFYIRNTKLSAQFPRVNLTVTYGSLPILAVSMLPVSLTPGVTANSAEIQIVSLNPGQIQAIVDDAWTGSNVAFTAVGPPEYVDLNILQKVLSYWRYRYEVLLAGSQGNNGSQTVTGGTLPHTTLSLTSSSYDTIGLGVELPFNSPLEFAIKWGDLTLSASYNSSAIINGTLALQQLLPGPNLVVANVSASAIGALRPKLEDFTSRFAFQRMIPNIMLTLTLNDTSYKYAPVVIKYGFSLPAMAGGSSSGVMRCTEMGQANPGIDLAAWGKRLLLFDWTWPACTIDSTLAVWFSNPLPFPLTIRILSFDLTFQDPDSLQENPFKLLTYIPGVSQYFEPDMSCPFAQIFEPQTGTLPPSDADGFGARPAGTQLSLPLEYAVGQIAPFNLIISTRNQSPITGTPADDPHYVLCIRLAEQYYNDKLTVDMHNGYIELGIGKFVITLSFEMLDYFIGGANTVKIPCKTQLGIPN